MTSNADPIRNSYNAFARGDIETVLAVLDPKVEWTEAPGFPTAGTYTGPEAVVAGAFVRRATGVGELRGRPRSNCIRRRTVVATGTYSGTSKETGRSFTARFAHVWELRDGVVIRFGQVADTAKVRDALA